MHIVATLKKNSYLKNVYFTGTGKNVQRLKYGKSIKVLRYEFFKSSDDMYVYIMYTEKRDIFEYGEMNFLFVSNIFYLKQV